MASLETPQDVLRCIAAVVGAVARGAITPSEDWVLINIILDRPVSPEEATVLYEDDEFWAAIEARVVSSDEE